MTPIVDAGELVPDGSGRFEERAADGTFLIQPVARVLEPWAVDARRPEPVGLLEGSFWTLIQAAEGESAGREGLAATPERAARAWRELTAGYRAELRLTTFDADGYDEIVAVTGLPFFSLCEHHLLPFHGTADFAYLPGERILGLSKFARILDHFSRRLQVQERLTKELADCLTDAVAPRGVLVRLSACHLCMQMRGVKTTGGITVTSVVRGRFRDDAAARQEAFGLLEAGRRG